MDVLVCHSENLQVGSEEERVGDLAGRSIKQNHTVAPGQQAKLLRRADGLRPQPPHAEIGIARELYGGRIQHNWVY